MNRFEGRESTNHRRESESENFAGSKGTQHLLSVKILVVGTGCGLSFDETIGVVKFEVFAWQSKARVFFDGHAEGFFISTSELCAPMGWMPSEIRVSAKICTGGDLVIDKGDAALRWLAELRRRCYESYRALIPVRSGGQHSSPLAGRVKLTRADGSTTTQTVPASAVEDIDGQLFIPLWLAIEKARTNKFKGSRRLTPAVEAALSKLERDLGLCILRLQEVARPLQEAERIDAPIRHKRMEEEQAQRIAMAKIEAEATRQRVAKHNQEVEEKEAKRSAALLTLPVLASNVTVRGHDWEKRAGIFYKKAWELHGATVRTSGSRAYIFLSDPTKPDFWKPLNCIKIVEADQQNAAT